MMKSKIYACFLVSLLTLSTGVSYWNEAYTATTFLSSIFCDCLVASYQKRNLVFASSAYMYIYIFTPGYLSGVFPKTRTQKSVYKVKSYT